MQDILTELTRILEERRQADPQTSYVASLHNKGLNKILEKVGEECTETLIAAKDAEISGKTDDLVYETADLWFHTMVMLSRFNLGPQDIINELARRLNVSGHAEKASRNS